MLPTIMVVSSEIVISSEKSLQVELDYSEIINHIQLHENKNFVYMLGITRNQGKRAEFCTELYKQGEVPRDWWGEG